ncbi:hypothetical protein M8J75_005616 [Diaphorina citri]|nr:hypothetical protein M8J75_005616 [Diaphorina citri]
MQFGFRSLVGRESGLGTQDRCLIGNTEKQKKDMTVPETTLKLNACYDMKVVKVNLDVFVSIVADHVFRTPSSTVLIMAQSGMDKKQGFD